jgi:acyl-CoA synthetase (NDP forming)
LAYWVGYDLDKPGQDYTDLINALQKLGAKRVMYSDWLVSSQMSAVQLRDYLRTFMDSNDRIVVAALPGDVAWANPMISHEIIQRIIAA